MSYADDLKVPHAGVKYEAVKKPKGNDGETVYKLDSGHYAAIRIGPPPRPETIAPHMFAWTAIARAIDAEGNPLLDHLGQPVVAEKTVSAPKISLVNPGKGVKNAGALKADALDKVINDEDGLAALMAAVEGYAE